MAKQNNPDNNHDVIEFIRESVHRLFAGASQRKPSLRAYRDDDAGLVDLPGTRKLVQNEWTHIAVVQDGDAPHLRMVNWTVWKMVNAHAWTSHLDFANGGLRLSAGSWGDYIGDMDDVVFTDWAPTQAQIKNLIKNSPAQTVE